VNVCASAGLASALAAPPAKPFSTLRRETVMTSSLLYPAALLEPVFLSCDENYCLRMIFSENRYTLFRIMR
jgi:hypothetical protein